MLNMLQSSFHMLFPLDRTIYFSDAVRIIYVSEFFSCSSLIAAEILPEKPNWN